MLKLIRNTVIVVVLVFGAFGALVMLGPDRRAREGAAGRGAAGEGVDSEAFSLANRQISINSSQGGTTFGNSPQAEDIARAISLRLKEIRTTQFSGGGRDQAIFTKGEFLTHCTITPTAVVLLCHVPELRKYTDDAKAAMRRHAWTTTQEALSAAGIKDPARTLFVALRGAVLYDLVMRGKTGENRHVDLSATEGTALIKAAMSATAPDVQSAAAPAAAASTPSTPSTPSVASPVAVPEPSAPAPAVPAPAASAAPGQ